MTGGRYELTDTEIAKWLERYTNEPWSSLPLAAMAAGDASPMLVFRELGKRFLDRRVDFAAIYATRKGSEA